MLLRASTLTYCSKKPCPECGTFMRYLINRGCVFCLQARAHVARLVRKRSHRHYISSKSERE